MRAPILIREARVWRKCPEIRTNVAKGMGYRIAYVMVAIPLILLVAPIFLLRVLFEILVPKLEDLEHLILFPAQWLRRKRADQIKKSHEIMPIKEIQKRVKK